MRPLGRRELVLLLIALGLTAAFHVFLVADRRLPRGHGTLEYYRLQKSCWEGKDLGVRERLAQSGPLQTLLLKLAGPLPARPFHAAFHAGLLLEELLLLAGCWLLGRRWFRSSTTTFFVATAAVGAASRPSTAATAAIRFVGL